MRLLSALTLLLALFFTACEPATTEEETDKEEMEEGTTSNTYKLTAFDVSTAYPDAKIEGMMYESGKFMFPITATDYVLGAQTPDADSKMCANSGKGQHIHLIVDNAPYAAKYENEFEYELEDGEHYILAFLSRSYHESIKTEEAHMLQKVVVEDGSFASSEAVEEPMLLYSRPKGTYVGEKDTKKVMLDFYVANLTLGADYKVKVEINGEYDTIADVWQPYYIEGLPMGDNKIKLTLVDGEGNIIDTPLNPVERVFTLKEDSAKEM
ncbi:MAG: hypothetical protein AAGG68_07170 [Bacteroidota bacterium]